MLAAGRQGDRQRASSRRAFADGRKHANAVLLAGKTLPGWSDARSAVNCPE